MLTGEEKREVSWPWLLQEGGKAMTQASANWRRCIAKCLPTASRFHPTFPVFRHAFVFFSFKHQQIRQLPNGADQGSKVKTQGDFPRPFGQKAPLGQSDPWDPGWSSLPKKQQEANVCNVFCWYWNTSILSVYTDYTVSTHNILYTSIYYNTIYIYVYIMY